MQMRTIGTVARPVMRPVIVQQPMSTGHTAFHHVGDVTDSAFKFAGLAAVGACAYHGYRRNKSVGWAVAWAVLAGLSPLITTGVAFAQGFGKAKGR